MVDHELTRALSDAVLELCCRDEALSQRLVAATAKLDLYLPRHERRPGIMRQRAHELLRELHAHSGLTPIIGRWNLTTAQRLAERVVHLYSELQAIWHHDAGIEPPEVDRTGNPGRGVDP